MVELRWWVPANGDRVLQYREKLYQGWSEWRTVPMESERDPSYP